MSSLSFFLFEILLNIGPKWRPFWKPRWRPKTERTNLLPSKFLYRKISTICVPKFTILSRSAHFISYIDLRAPTILSKYVTAVWTMTSTAQLLLNWRRDNVIRQQAGAEIAAIATAIATEAVQQKKHLNHWFSFSCLLPAAATSAAYLLVRCVSERRAERFVRVRRWVIVCAAVHGLTGGGEKRPTGLPETGTAGCPISDHGN